MVHYLRYDVSAGGKIWFLPWATRCANFFGFNVLDRGKRDSADFDFWATRGKREEGATLAEN